MTVRLPCPHCHAVGRLPKEHLGKTVRCPMCGQKIRTEKPTEAVPPHREPDAEPVPDPSDARAPVAQRLGGRARLGASIAAASLLSGAVAFGVIYSHSRTPDTAISTSRGHPDPTEPHASTPQGRPRPTAGTTEPQAPSSRATVVVQLGHSGLISSVTFSPDGKQVLTGSQDKTARLWDRASGKLIRTFEGHSSYIDSVAFSPDGKLVLTGSQDKTARLWDVASGQEIRVLNGHTSRIFSVAFSPDGKQVLTGSFDKTVRLWDVASGKENRTFGGGTSQVQSVAFSPDGKQVLAGSVDRTARLWDTATGREIRTFQGGNGIVSIFSPDGKKVCKGSRLFDVASGREILALQLEKPLFIRGRGPDPAAKAPENPLTLMPDRYKAALGARAGPAAKKAPQKPAVKRDPRPPARGARAGPPARAKVPPFPVVRPEVGVRSAAFSPDGRQLVTASPGMALLWDATTGKEIARYEGHSGSVHGVAFSPDGTHILTGGADRTARLFATAGGNDSRTLQGLADTVLSVAFSPDGKRALAGGTDQKARLWDLARGTRTGVFHGGTVVAFSPDGKQVLTASDDRTAQLWDATTGTEIRTFSGHKQQITSAAISRDGRRIMTASEDRTARVWDADTGREIARIPGDGGLAHSAALSPDGERVLVTGGMGPESDARLWDVASGKMTSFFRGHRFTIKAVAFSPDGQRVLTGAWDETARLWDAGSGRHIRTFRVPTLGLRNMVDAVAFSPDGKQVLTGSSEHMVRLWDADSGRVIRDFQGHTARIESVAFSRDGKRILTGSRDGTARLWDTASGQELCRLIALRNEAWTAVSPENYYMASRKALDGVAFRIGDRSFPFDQFDLKFNRPDKVIERIGLASPELVAAYRQLYRKRLRKMNFTEDMLSDDFHLPEVSLNPGVPTSTREKNLKLAIRASDSKYTLDRIRVDVNGVPVHGTDGIDLRPAASMNWEREIELELSPGRNRVDVSALNEKGAESLKETFSIQCDAPARKPDLYVLVVGISEYQDAARRLTYADKDAKDLADLLQAKRDHFGEVKELRILNRDATRETIRGAKDFLGASQVDDLVVAFFAGHGLLDSKLDYYFGTSDIDFADPATRGLPFEAIEDLLDGIRSRRKLLLVDTCHAGELDRDDVAGIGAERKPRNEVKERSFRGLTRVTPRVGLSPSYNLAQEMFADLRRGTGAVIIASAGGSEFALEGARWNNGVFTHAILRGLNGEADRDGDRRVMVSELRDFVEAEVQQLTNGKQSPTARRENLVADFTLD